jgi:MoxR-like ATPase
MGAAAPDAALAGAAGADAPALASAALALALVPAAGVAEPADVDSLLPQALSKITDRPKQRLAFRTEFERVFFIFSDSKGL